MESESNVSDLQPAKKLVRREGQRRARRLAEESSRTSLFLVLPTGYGKTLAAIDCYCARRALGVTRLLVLVPSDELRNQWAKDAGRLFALLGEEFSAAIAVDRPERAFTYHQRGTAEVFVATYQQVNRDGLHWFEELTSTGSWMVVNDEVHHLAVGGEWGHDAERRVRRDFTLSLSATPSRADRRALVGADTVDDEDGTRVRADVEVTWKEALLEGAIRPVRAHISDYWIDVLADSDDKPIRITAKSLLEDGVRDAKDFSAFETRRRLRYRHDYIAPMLYDAIGVLAQKNHVAPGEHQMIVNAMSNTHAETTCQIIRQLAGDESFADWVGMSRPAKENKAVIARFRGFRIDEEGREVPIAAADRLQCLVQIDMIGEGFSCDRISVAVFLNLVRAQSKLAQQLGRILRRNAAIPLKEDNADAFASEDSPVGELVEKFEVQVGAIVEQGDDVDGPGDDDEPRLLNIPEVRIMGAEFIEKRMVLSHGARDIRSREQQSDALRAAGFGELEIAKMLDAIKPNGATPLAGYSSETEALSAARAQVDSAVTIFTRNAIQLLARGGTRIDPSVPGRIKQTVHKRWIMSGGLPHSKATADDLRRKSSWLASINREMKESREAPTWLRG